MVRGPLITERDMSSVTQIVFDGKPLTFEGRELTTADVILCAAEVERLAVAAYIARPRVTEGSVRDWLGQNRPGTDTTRQEFDEAVRRYLMTRWNVS